MRHKTGLQNALKIENASKFVEDLVMDFDFGMDAAEKFATLNAGVLTSRRQLKASQQAFPRTTRCR